MSRQSPRRRRPGRPGRESRGSVLIEFALIVPFLLVLTFCVVDISRAFFVKNMLHQAAREGARVFVVTNADSADIRIRQVMDAVSIPVTSIDHLGPTNKQMGIRVGTTFHWLYPGLFGWMGTTFQDPMPLTAEAWMRKETP